MAQRFTDKVVLVTGASSGIGRTTALAFAREGATVVVAGRRAAALDATVEEIAASGGKASAVVADVSQGDAMRAAVSTAVERHGGLHVAVNNAGMLGRVAPLADLGEDDWSQVLATNLTGLWLALKHEVTHMRAHGGGTIVNVASNLGAHERRAGFGAYAATKAGVSVLTRTAAREYLGDNIRINAVSPGPIDTPMSFGPGESVADRDARLADSVPLGRAGMPEEVAAAVLYLASEEAGFTVGHDLVLDGGVTA
ncbi:SDR family NAD(P)-dependent oxidoreductase [Cryptosporangium arvum]|uniref:SDR family NAD(P)-dependent oxidoreductase n=1 Tax=Cryptosporangium arvum TaxID=80871 RepID=UPI0004B96490|nr:SDR family NAD(P)-dependent oxidoreductase [Cryptosporangium arvum]